jgi:tetratricopeptide (TPR) repeat protein
MSGQTIRWGMAFAATTALSASLLLSAGRAPALLVVEAVAKRDPASVPDVELELILNKVREGDLLSQKGDAAGSARAWQEARRLGEGLWPIHEGLGDSYARAKRFDDALREYQQAASLVPEQHVSMRLAIGAKRAAALASAGRPLEAVQAYLDLRQPELFAANLAVLAAESDRAVELIERHAEIYDARLFRLAAALQSKRDRKVEAALALGNFAVRVAPWDENVVREAVAGLREARRFEAAADVCRAWVRAVPQAIGGYQLLGEVLWDAGLERESLIAVSSMVDVRPGDPTAHRVLGEIYLKRNRPDEAMAQFERGWKAAPQDQGLRVRMAEFYQARLEKLKAEGKGDELRAVRQKLAELNVLEAGLFDLKVIITWDVKSDVDLDVIEPDGTKINHASSGTSKIGGRYYADNTQGFGPETYTLAKARPGRWRIGAHLHSGAKSTVKFAVLLYEDTPKEERREETIILDKVGHEATVFIRDLVIP